MTNWCLLPPTWGAVCATPRWCASPQVQWVSVPLSNAQAGNSLKANMYAFDAHQIDTAFYGQHCAAARGGRNSSSSSGGGGGGGGRRRRLRQADQRQQQQQQQPEQQQPEQQQQQQQARRPPPLLAAYGLPPEHTCDRLPVGEDVVPIPVMAVEVFGHMQGVLQASYAAFAAVRAAIGA
jgi:hypothetical protein